MASVLLRLVAGSAPPCPPGIQMAQSPESGDRRRGGGPSRGGKLQRPLVMVVDDDRDARTIYRDYLRAMGCRVVTARDGAAALARVAHCKPDLIVMDLVMPRVDGWTAARRLRELPRTRHVPIIALTAMPTSRNSARRAGCDAFLAKPCLPELLWWEVRVLLELEDVDLWASDPSARQHQQDGHEQQNAQAAARMVAPPRAVRPRRQRQNQQRDHESKQ
jgi:two-component system cell cycle response regulator DivK